MPYGTIDDVRIYAPDVTDETDEVAKVDYLLERAEDLIVIAFPDIDSRVADGRTPVGRVAAVEGEMVAAVMNNPRARQSESQTVGGLSTSHTVNTAVASGLLRLTDDHRKLILGVSVLPGTSGGAAYTVSLWG